jgi:hypothetical protein
MSSSSNVHILKSSPEQNHIEDEEDEKMKCLLSLDCLKMRFVLFF